MACSKLETRPPEGCYLGNDCSCAFDDGRVLTYEQWTGVNAQKAERRESTYFIVFLVLAVVLIFGYKWLKRKLTQYKSI